jgi:hypothetical protein
MTRVIEPYLSKRVIDSFDMHVDLLGPEDIAQFEEAV